MAAEKWRIQAADACGSLPWGAYMAADSGGSKQPMPVGHSYGAPTRQQIVADPSDRCLGCAPLGSCKVFILVILEDRDSSIGQIKDYRVSDKLLKKADQECLYNIPKCILRTPYITVKIP
jgi:hypothetical protein